MCQVDEPGKTVRFWTGPGFDQQEAGIETSSFSIRLNYVKVFMAGAGWRVGVWTKPC